MHCDHAVESVEQELDASGDCSGSGGPLFSAEDLQECLQIQKEEYGGALQDLTYRES